MRVSDSFKITRRDLMVVGAVTIAAGAAPAMALEQLEGSTTAWPEDFLPKVAFTVNGEPRSLSVATRDHPRLGARSSRVPAQIN